MISIIIPTLNEEKYLPILLKSIKNQTYKNYEIIVADNKSKDKTRQIAKKFGCRIVDGGLPAKARNNGAKIANGKYLLFLDADSRIGKFFIENLIIGVKQKKLDYTTCFLIPDSKRIEDKIIFFFGNLFAYLLQNIRPLASGSVLLVKKSIFEKTGGFDESLKNAEDFDFSIRAYKYGKFGILTKPKIYISVRRFDSMGRINLLKDILYPTMYFVITKKHSSYEYKFENKK
ncbi:glycosyltransferase [Candidatus Woesearchaeota archaeon]|nr:glycosyltransferase [Candidatus Woesearchaeota archaeon]